MLAATRRRRAAPEPANPSAATPSTRRRLVSRRVNTIEGSSYFAVFAFFGGDTNSLMPRNFLHTSLLER